jgi:hypothetical protein
MSAIAMAGGAAAYSIEGRVMLRFLLIALALIASTIASPSRAEVVATFWSHERDQNYPHAFIVLRGRIDATGEVVDTNIGFTARRISPGILLGSVEGMMETVSAGYIARPTSRPHFALRLDDAGYARLMAFIAQWRAREQPSYNLRRRNCVHFVMEAAALFGLAVNRDSRHFRNPRAFLDEVMRLNPRLTPATR